MLAEALWPCVSPPRAHGSVSFQQPESMDGVRVQVDTQVGAES